MASAGKRSGHQDQAEIVVGLAVAGINAQDLAKLFFRQIEFFLSDVNVSRDCYEFERNWDRASARAETLPERGRSPFSLPYTIPSRL